MAERAGLFEARDPIDYGLLTKGTFVWHLWIEEETRRRFDLLTPSDCDVASYKLLTYMDTDLVARYSAMILVAVSL